MATLQQRYIRSDQFFIQAHVNGVNMPTHPSWQSMEGGNVEAETQIFHPGGILQAVAMPGPASRKDITVRRPYATDWHPILERLERAVGTTRGWVAWRPLDAHRAPAGKIIQVDGLLKSVEFPNWDSNSSAVGVLALTFACDQ